jgi:hypothetical protein
MTNDERELLITTADLVSKMMGRQLIFSPPDFELLNQLLRRVKARADGIEEDMLR